MLAIPHLTSLAWFSQVFKFISFSSNFFTATRASSWYTRNICESVCRYVKSHVSILSWKSKLVTREGTRICCKQMPYKVTFSLKFCFLHNSTRQWFEFCTLLFRAICKSGSFKQFICSLLCKFRFPRRCSDEIRFPRHFVVVSFVPRSCLLIVQCFHFSFECSC